MVAVLKKIYLQTSNVEFQTFLAEDPRCNEREVTAGEGAHCKKLVSHSMNWCPTIGEILATGLSNRLDSFFVYLRVCG